MHAGMGSRITSTDEMLETENNRMVDDLAAKVSRLKGVRRHKPPQKILIHLWSHSSALLNVMGWSCQIHVHIPHGTFRESGVVSSDPSHVSPAD